MRLDAIKMLARLYWYTDRVRPRADPGGRARLRRGGCCPPGGELAYCVDDPKPRRRPFELERILRTEYRIDRYPGHLFVQSSPSPS